MNTDHYQFLDATCIIERKKKVNKLMERFEPNKGKMMFSGE